MSIITRPTKTGGGTDVVAGNDVLAVEWNGDLNTIYNDYDGNITDANCSAAMGLQGTKLADAPSGVPTIKINDNAVTSAKLQSDAAIDGNRAVTRNHIRAGVVSLDKLGALVQTVHAANVSVAASSASLVTVVRWTNGANYEATVISISPAGAINFVNIVPSTPIPTATKELIGLYVANVAFVNPNTSCDVIFVSIDRT